MYTIKQKGFYHLIGTRVALPLERTLRESEKMAHLRLSANPDSEIIIAEIIPREYVTLYEWLALP